jgi:hypothetical protein
MVVCDEISCSAVSRFIAHNAAFVLVSNAVNTFCSRIPRQFPSSFLISVPVDFSLSSQHQYWAILNESSLPSTRIRSQRREDRNGLISSFSIPISMTSPGRIQQDIKVWRCLLEGAIDFVSSDLSVPSRFKDDRHSECCLIPMPNIFRAVALVMTD